MRLWQKYRRLRLSVSPNTKKKKPFLSIVFAFVGVIINEGKQPKWFHRSSEKNADIWRSPRWLRNRTQHKRLVYWRRINRDWIIMTFWRWNRRARKNINCNSVTTLALTHYPWPNFIGRTAGFISFLLADLFNRRRSLTEWVSFGIYLCMQTRSCVSVHDKQTGKLPERFFPQNIPPCPKKVYRYRNRS